MIGEFVEVAGKALEKGLEAAEKVVESLGDKLEQVVELPKTEGMKIKDFFSGLEENLDFEDSLLEDKLDLNSLTLEEKSLIFQETGWSDEIIDCIRSREEYEIYKNADLIEVKVNDRSCLIKKDFDSEYISYDRNGNPKTNRELMAEGKSPYDYKTGEKLELHHMGQKHDSPLVELCEKSEHGDNHGILHDNKSESWRQDDKLKNHYNNVERPQHWKNRPE